LAQDRKRQDRYRTGRGLSVAAKKGTKMAAKWSPARGAVWSEPFPLLRSVVRNGPEPSKGAPLLGAAKRTLDGEDRQRTGLNVLPSSPSLVSSAVWKL
jgi:hypothetical protein